MQDFINSLINDVGVDELEDEDLNDL